MMTVLVEPGHYYKLQDEGDSIAFKTDHKASPSTVTGRLTLMDKPDFTIEAWIEYNISATAS